MEWPNILNIARGWHLPLNAYHCLIWCKHSRCTEVATQKETDEGRKHIVSVWFPLQSLRSCWCCRQMRIGKLNLHLFRMKKRSKRKTGCTLEQGFLRCFRDPFRVPRIENRAPRISENHHRVPGIKENRVPRIREIGSLQVHIGYLTFSLKKLP